jgi:type IV secretion system protein VirB11
MLDTPAQTNSGGGLTAAKREMQRRLQEKLTRELGAVVRAALADPGVIEIMLNADGCLWIERTGEEMSAAGAMNAAAAEQLIATVAAGVGTTVTFERPALECDLPVDGSRCRFAGMIPPAADAPIFAIRRHAARVFTLDEYVSDGIATAAQVDTLREAVRARRNILVAGGTGSGKTTLTNAIIAEFPPAHRLVIIEDTPELQCAAPNAIFFRAAQADEERTMQRLLKRAMRYRPDRIVIGEVRGPEALDLIQAWNTGHPGGVATVHANTAAADDALDRIESLVAQGSAGDQRRLIGKAIELIAVITREREGRRLKRLVRVAGFADGAYQLQEE